MISADAVVDRMTDVVALQDLDNLMSGADRIMTIQTQPSPFARLRYRSEALRFPPDSNKNPIAIKVCYSPDFI